MDPRVLHRPNALSPPFSKLPFRAKWSLGPRATASPSPSPSRWVLPRSRFLRLPRVIDYKGVGAVRFDVPVVDSGEMSEVGDGDLVVETCIVRTLQPALTLEHGLEKIKEALEKLGLDPPRSSRGMLRFQVAVPPSAKALNWFCCQPESPGVFPQFFLSKETDNPTCKSLLLHDIRGVFGIGAAVHFSSSTSTEDRRTIRRYLSNDSTVITVYGFLDIDFDTESTSIKNEADSFYLFIPQIELDENDGISTLAVTLAWDETCLHSIKEAIHSCKLSINQACSHFWPGTEKYHISSIRSTIRKLDMLETNTVKMVYLNSVSGRDFVADPLELKEAPSSCQFCFKLSPTFAVSSNMLDHATELSFSLQSHANINAVWASLIIEECSRLGLTYVCVAPGSRSSPLAIAASSHPLITCIACYDERSLAFHALGYARGSQKPAVIITSSGTAVSNLLPAVVEASQDFIPLLLLTADRPPELHDAGANQAINQVNHFGSYVRFFFSLPVPADHVPARMVLTTLDSAVHWAISSPYGPVHINCPFREPLDNSPSKWMLSCLKQLDSWICSPEPFTKYIRPQHLHECKDTRGQMTGVIKLINEANRGLLIIGAIRTEDEIWAALLLARHLSWPIVADILSGLRLRKLLTPFPEIEDRLLFVDHLDHALLSDSVKNWIQIDAIIQIGSRITSKRVSQMLEDISPSTYIMVADHPYRHDPSHIVTHRIQSSIIQFADSLLRSQFQHKTSSWSVYLQALNMAVSRDLSFQILATYSLTEPQLAYTVSEALSPECALFVGNSMAIRDLDMYGHGGGKCTDSVASMMSNVKLSCHGVRVAGNRGASGIDGLLSTAVGFAVGCSKRVFCVMGDVSFLHDTNGLAILSQRASRKPMVVLVINNHGGAIFSLLPIANKTDPKVLDQYFYTSHNISFNKLCSAHGIKHVRVQTKLELQDALLTSQNEESDCVIEVESSIATNASFHSILRNSASRAADHALGMLSGLSAPDSILRGFFLCKIHKMEFSLYRIALLAPPTSTLVNGQIRFYREGFILSICLDDGSVGFGEVAPLEIHTESLLDVEEQLKFLLHVIKGAKISYSIPLLMCSSWIWNELGIPPSSIFPSVRCGMEMAILSAIAARRGSNLLNLLHPLKDEEIPERSSGVQVCALIDSDGTPNEVAHLAATLVGEGFTAIKLKVARRGDPTEDAAVIIEVRKMVGHRIDLRVDANRNWNYEEALEFGSCVKNCNLQYIEEPVRNEADIVKFFEETGVPVALDETIENIQDNPLIILEKYIHSGIVAVVIKPSVVGGFENAAIIARWAQQHGKLAVLSATFESSVCLSAYAQFSCYLELQNVERCKVMNGELGKPIAHGLGTYRWLEEDVTTDPLRIRRNVDTGFVEASVMDANRVLQNFQINHKVVLKTFNMEQVREYQLDVDSHGFSYSIKVHETGKTNDSNVLIFLHGFLGTGKDWIRIMKAISGSARCISIDLPGHGGSTIQNHAINVASEESTLSIENIADVVCKVINHVTDRKVTIVGYSMGARIALFTALSLRNQIEGAVIISGSPGLRDKTARRNRKAKDDSKARSLLAYGLQSFLDSWYSGDLWKSLREHPHFDHILKSRSLHVDMKNLARTLSDLSAGRQPSLWEELKQCKVPLLLVVGSNDLKFKRIAREMLKETESDDDGTVHDMVEIRNCGHAVHLENPLQTIRALRQFLSFLESERNATDSKYQI